MKVKWKDESGLTLLELSFAAGILAMALAMLFGSLLNVGRIGEVSEERTQAVTQLAGVMEQLRKTSFSKMVSYTQPSLTQPGVARAVLLEAYDKNGAAVALPWTGGGTAPTESNFPNPMEVKATLVWQDEGGRSYQVSAATRIGR